MMGPTGLILRTNNGEEFSRIGFFNFEPPQEDEVQGIGNFSDLIQLSNDRQEVQEHAFQNITPRTITII
jgi:hypothetical protein